MRICIHKATKHILEMQSHATEGTLISNAINAGYLLADIEEKVVTEAEYEAAKLADPVEQASKIEREETATVESLIQAKMRDTAITDLKKEGKLTADGKIKK
jgi:hypothetical protein